MSKHLSMRSGNPALNKNTFKNITTNSDQVMTIDGTVNKIATSLFILLLAAAYTFTSDINFIIPGLIGGFIVALITIFKKEWSPYTVPIYAGLEGLALGGISLIFNNMYPGIAQQAIFLTFGIFAALLFAYKTKIIQVTQNFRLGIFAATVGIGLAYFINLIVFWISGEPFYFMTIGQPNAPAPLMSIGFSVFVVIIASLNLVLDFDFIEEASKNNVPKYMEWYGAFGLLVTLIWLYLEILRLLAKLYSRRS